MSLHNTRLADPVSPTRVLVHLSTDHAGFQGLTKRRRCCRHAGAAAAASMHGRCRALARLWLQRSLIKFGSMSGEEGVQLFSSKPQAKKRRLAAPAPAPDAAEQRTAASEAPLEAAKPAAALAPEDQQLASAEPGSEATFRQLGLSEWLDRVCAGLGMQAPTAVQRGTIPAVLAGRDVIGVAHTGSGKTAAFALPILQKLAKDPYGVFALVLTPTRCVRADMYASPPRL